MRVTRSAGGHTVSCEDVMLPHPQYSDVNRDVVRTLAVPSARWITVCGLTLLCLALALSRQIDLGVGVTGLRTPHYWAFYITNFMFWIGIGHDDLRRHDGGAVSPDPRRATVVRVLLVSDGAIRRHKQHQRNGGTHQ